MLSPAAFIETMKSRSVRAYYYNDMVLGGADGEVDDADIDRLVAEGFLVAEDTAAPSPV
jgi:hypothetical protein